MKLLYDKIETGDSRFLVWKNELKVSFLVWKNELKVSFLVWKNESKVSFLVWKNELKQVNININR